MQVFDKGKIYDFMKFRYFTFALSAVLIIGSIALFFIKGINYGIDFSGGTLIQVKYDAKAPSSCFIIDCSRTIGSARRRSCRRCDDFSWRGFQP